MNDAARGVVVSHRSVGQALVDAVGSIVGPDHGLTAVTNDGCSLHSLGERLNTAVNGGPCIVFVDMLGGSCFMAAARILRDRPGVFVVAGVNLPMLLDFAQHRTEDVQTVVRRMAEVGAKSIRVMPS